MFSGYLSNVLFFLVGKFILYGIISWGFSCAEPNRPGVYVKIKHYLDWIQKIFDND